MKNPESRLAARKSLCVYLIAGTFAAFGLFLIFGGTASGNEAMVASGVSVCGVAAGMLVV